MKKLFPLIILLLVASCIEEPQFEDTTNETTLEDISFEGFNFETGGQVKLAITDYTQGTAKYKVSYMSDGEVNTIGSFFKKGSGLSTDLFLPTSVEELLLIKSDAKGAESYIIKVSGNSAN
ncbi:MAG: hypothetical protein JJ909_00915, partial [Roseivirga sp.]|nr:hypothetical protein [Roseivirga sp.]